MDENIPSAAHLHPSTGQVPPGWGRCESKELKGQERIGVTRGKKHLVSRFAANSKHDCEIRRNPLASRKMTVTIKCNKTTCYNGNELKCFPSLREGSLLGSRAFLVRETPKKSLVRTLEQCLELFLSKRLNETFLRLKSYPKREPTCKLFG